MSEQILLKQDLISTLSPNELIVYIAIRSIYTTLRNEPICINPVEIYAELAEDLGIKQSVRQNIIDGIESLNSKKLINIIQRGINSTYLVDISGTYFDSFQEYFVYVDKEGLRNILKAKTSVNKLGLIKYYVILLCCFAFENYAEIEDKKIVKRVYGNPTLDTLSMKSNMPVPTLIKYNSELERLKVIHIFKRKMFNNVYCIYKFKEKVKTKKN